MRRKRLSILTAAAGLILSAGVFADVGTTGATTPPVSSPNLITQLAVPTTAPVVAPAPAPVLPTEPAATPAVTPAASAPAPLTNLPTSPPIPITASGNGIGGSLRRAQDSATGTNTTVQASPLANVGAAVNVTIGVKANANGDLGQAASALGPTSGQPSAQTSATQPGMPIPGFPLVNDLPTNAITPSAAIDGVPLLKDCSIVLAVDASTGAQCEPPHGAPRQTGSVPIDAPVTLCSIEGIPSNFCTGDGNTALPTGIPPLLLWALAATGAPLLFELMIGAMALLTGLMIGKLSRRGASRIRPHVSGGVGTRGQQRQCHRRQPGPEFRAGYSPDNGLTTACNEYRATLLYKRG